MDAKQAHTQADSTQAQKKLVTEDSDEDEAIDQLKAAGERANAENAEFEKPLDEIQPH